MITLGEGAAALAGGKGASGAGAIAKAEALGGKEGVKVYSVAYEIKLPKVGAGNRPAHFRAANDALAADMRASPELTKAMHSLNIEVPTTSSGASKGISPEGWTWHHVPDKPGLLQLVPRSQHTAGSPFYDSMHPTGQGGFYFWGKEF